MNMKKLRKFTGRLGVLTLAFVVPLIASAQASPALPTGGSNVPNPNITSVTDVTDLFCVIFGWAFYFLITLSVIFVVIGAYRYLTSAGEAEKIKNANNTLLYAAIAVGVALLAKGIPLIVGDFLGASAGGPLLAC